MPAAIRGRLISSSFAEHDLQQVHGAAEAPDDVIRALDVWALKRESACGPASPVRAIADVIVIPLLNILGFQTERRQDDRDVTAMHAITPAQTVIPVLIVGWAEPLDGVWRSTVLNGVAADARWCFCASGTALRVVDGQHTWSRAYVEFDLGLIALDAGTRTLLWSIARADALSTAPTVLDRAAALSAQHGAVVCRSLGRGVLQALALLYESLRKGHAKHSDVYEQSLTILYRVLFLLFAEARGLVPMWHHVYRDRYSIDAIVTTLISGRACRGIWHSLVAISRLAHAGCSAGELRVTAFNGRLFSPAYAGAFDRTRIVDDVMAGAVLALSTTSQRTGGRTRIAYRDLDVEQLGTVYEHVLEHEPRHDGLDCTKEGRKSTGTFYTPRAVTAFLVRQTLAPLVARRSFEEILRLRVVDLAMGSGAFLVGACRYLAAEAEETLVREGRWHRGEVTSADRASLRREIAQRCLYGVDLNPMAVQLARLSMWLVTLAADKPLTFLDHHLVAGNSLVGASPDDIRRQPSKGGRVVRRQDLPLFESGDVMPILERAVRTRNVLAQTPDDSAAIVRSKEQTLAALTDNSSPLSRLSRGLDLWCAGWFWQQGPPPGPAVFAELYDRALHDRATLPARTTDTLLDGAAAVAERYRFFHWTTAFPEVFCDESGAPLSDGGFDAVIGNPPWDMVRGDAGDAAERNERRDDARKLTDFVREAGIYQVDSKAHANRYQLFVERALQLTRRGGRVGLVLPSGCVTDTGAAALRRHLFDRAAVDTVIGLDNRHAIFPIHRSTRFVLATWTKGAPTTAIACRFGLTHADQLEAPQERGLVVTRRLLSRLSGEDDLGIPEFASEHDFRIVEAISARFPRLGSQDGWAARFGRELNASDDAGSFVPYTGSRNRRPVVEGKQIEPFRTFPDRSRFELPAGVLPGRVPRRARLAYRDVASATNRVTLIAAVLPARVVTTHTLFCLKTPLTCDAQHVLCALLNSLVANYLIRMRVNTHVTVALVSRLPMPLVHPDDPEFTTLARLARSLAQSEVPAEERAEYAESQARAARLYQLSEEAFAHVLETFPLIPRDVRSAVLAAFTRLR